MSGWQAIRRVSLSLLMGGALFASGPADMRFPADHRQLKTTLSFEDMTALLKSAAKPGLITVSEEGRSAGGRPIFLVRLNRGGAKARCRVFFYAQQHGNEVSGKDALLYMVRSIAEHPERLPEDVDLYLMPMVNPDGAVANQRRNDTKADLNRDHLLQSQPEIQAFYRVARRVLPHLAADCHEFTRDGEDYVRIGEDHVRRAWERWPIITLDACNHPLIPASLKIEGLRVVETAAPVLAKAGHPYARYTVGGPAPEEEIRPSTPEVDDGRNGLGSHGAVSFIIEAGVRRSAKDPQADLGIRVDAYLTLFQHLLGTPESRARIFELSEKARREPLPPFIATNTFWGNVDGKVGLVKMSDPASGQVLEIPTANLMLDLVVKSSVPTPKAYVIEARAAKIFRPLLEHHGLVFRELAAAERLKAERCRLVRWEAPYDELYQRYENRTIVARDAAVEREFPAGTLVVALDQPLARRAIQVLEPCLLYGLYSYAEFRALALPDGALPVQRLP
ncbi:MAG: M14 family zinc carboxypeptidase [Holophaga sp.]